MATAPSTWRAKSLDARVHARNFHKWCRQQLVAFGQELPRQGPGMFDEMVDRVIRAVDRGHIPAGQYRAILIDEGHDFRPEWLKLVTQMVDPETDSLLLLYDDAQSIYERARAKKFSFKSVGVKAQGRTTILKINYRNTKQILQTASLVAADLLRPEDADEDGIPLVQPISYGREGEPAHIVRLPSVRDEAREIADRLASAHAEGFAWSDMAVICCDYSDMDVCAAALHRKGVPHQVRRSSGDFQPAHDSIKILTARVSKGLEFPVLAMPGLGKVPLANQDEAEQARIFYVAATRATQRLMITYSADSKFTERLAAGRQVSLA